VGNHPDAPTRVTRFLDLLREGPKTMVDLVAVFGQHDARQVVAEARRQGYHIATTPILNNTARRGGPRQHYSLSDLPAPTRPRGGGVPVKSSWRVDEPSALAVGSVVTVRNGALIVRCTVTALEYTPQTPTVPAVGGPVAKFNWDTAPDADRPGRGGPRG